MTAKLSKASIGMRKTPDASPSAEPVTVTFFYAAAGTIILDSRSGYGCVYEVVPRGYRTIILCINLAELDFGPFDPSRVTRTAVLRISKLVPAY